MTVSITKIGEARLRSFIKKVRSEALTVILTCDLIMEENASSSSGLISSLSEALLSLSVFSIRSYPSILKSLK